MVSAAEQCHPGSTSCNESRWVSMPACKIHFTYRAHPTRGRNRRSFSLLLYGSYSNPSRRSRQNVFTPHCYQRVNVMSYSSYNIRYEQHSSFTYHEIVETSRPSLLDSEARFDRRENHPINKAVEAVHRLLKTRSTRL